MDADLRDNCVTRAAVLINCIGTIIKLENGQQRKCGGKIMRDKLTYMNFTILLNEKSDHTMEHVNFFLFSVFRCIIAVST